MAKTKTTEEKKVLEEEEITEEEKVETQAEIKPVDPFEETVEKNYPLSRGEDDFIYAEVNGKGYKVKRGVPVQVPKPIAEVIDNKLKMDYEAYRFIEHNKKED